MGDKLTVAKVNIDDNPHTPSKYGVRGIPTLMVFKDGQVAEMNYQEDTLDEYRVATFTGAIPCRISGRHGYALRILPRHPDLAEAYESGLILWESAH